MDHTLNYLSNDGILDLCMLKSHLQATIYIWLKDSDLAENIVEKREMKY